MKTIEQAAQELADKFVKEGQFYPANNNDFIDAFESGVEFAQRFYPIERDKDWFTTSKQDEEFQKNFPILVKGNYGIELLDELTSDLNRQSYGYTHWRPIELK